MISSYRFSDLRDSYVFCDFAQSMDNNTFFRFLIILDTSTISLVTFHRLLSRYYFSLSFNFEALT